MFAHEEGAGGHASIGPNSCREFWNGRLRLQHVPIFCTALRLSPQLRSIRFFGEFRLNKQFDDVADEYVVVRFVQSEFFAADLAGSAEP